MLTHFFEIQSNIVLPSMHLVFIDSLKIYVCPSSIMNTYPGHLDLISLKSCNMASTGSYEEYIIVYCQ